MDTVSDSLILIHIHRPNVFATTIQINLQGGVLFVGVGAVSVLTAGSQ